MKILLLGEYSKLHNSLKAGLTRLGHEVTLAGTGDSFKRFPVDRSFAPKWTTDLWLFRTLRRVVFRLFKIDLSETERGIRFYFLLPQLKGFDHIQLINSNALGTHPRWSLYLLKKLFQQRATASLLVCGDETPITDYLLKREMAYSVLTPYFENPNLEPMFRYVLKYSDKNYRKLFEFVDRHSAVRITSDIDYKLPMDAMGYENTFIPNPILPEENQAESEPNPDKITIFLGINRLSAIKKGIPFFEKALQRIAENYPDKVEVQVVENLPYEDYIKTYKKAAIFLDMVYAYDQGYNALEAMAKGKVVFTGAEKEFLQHYNLQEDEVCINALPDVDYLVEKLTKLIEHPAEIRRIGQNARAFVTREHDYIEIAKRYLTAWEAHEG